MPRPAVSAPVAANAAVHCVLCTAGHSCALLTMPPACQAPRPLAACHWCCRHQPRLHSLDLGQIKAHVLVAVRLCSNNADHQLVGANDWYVVWTMQTRHGMRACWGGWGWGAHLDVGCSTQPRLHDAHLAELWHQRQRFCRMASSANTHGARSATCSQHARVPVWGLLTLRPNRASRMRSIGNAVKPASTPS
jgi:hypothetical protein